MGFTGVHRHTLTSTVGGTDDLRPPLPHVPEVSVFASLGSWCFRRRKTVAIAWVVGIILVGAVSGAVGGSFGQDFNPPGFESTRGRDTLEATFGDLGTGIPGTVVFRAEQGVDDPEVEKAMTDLFAMITTIAADPEVDIESDPVFASLSDDARAALQERDLTLLQGITVISPYAPGPEPQIASEGAEAGKIAFASLEIPGDDWEEAGKVGRTLEEILPSVDGLQVELGGGALGEFEEPSTEALGLAFAVVILVVAFGSVMAMGLPIGVAISGIAAGSVIVTILSNLITMPDFAPFLGIMIGLGVGIDYALFIVTRYRENLHHGHTPEDATSIAIDTAGRAVAFAGVTVVVSFLGMLVMGVSFIQGLAVSAAVVVALTVVASLTLLPALLGFAGERIEVSRWRGVVATGFAALGLVGAGLQIAPLAGAGFFLAIVVVLAGFVVAPLKREVPRRPPKPVRETFAYRWSRFIQFHPWPSAIVGAVLLVVLALPVLGLRLGFSDESNFQEDTTTRQAYELLVDGFGAGHNGPFFLAARVDGPADQAVLDGITAAVAADPGIAFVSPAIPSNFQDPSRAVTAYLWRITPTSSPQDAATTELVHRLRDEVLVDGEAALGSEVAVTGQVPGTVDFSGFLSARMPYFFVAVLLVSFLLMMAVFRSLLVPLKAVIMNLLSIGAAYGITVAIVQWGWLSDVTGLTPGPIETFAPMMFFAIVFGLSMDYEVFLLSRVKEEWHRTGDSHLSVANGLATTARVITAAAAIMVFVFGSFMLENDRTFKLFGVGLASAIFLDATIVRMLLVPATMELLGDRNWWLPRWLDRLLPSRGAPRRGRRVRRV
jgi:RND superfamily putative drug exporter